MSKSFANLISKWLIVTISVAILLTKANWSQAAPLTGSSEATSNIEQPATSVAAEVATAPVVAQTPVAPKVTRDVSSSLKGLDHLDTQESFLPSGYQNADSDYVYDSSKNNYGKQASDWSLYDQGNHGLYDKYGDKAWADQAHNQHSNHGKHDSYGNSYNNAGSNHGSGYYMRDKGYGYEKHYAYDKEIASKQHADNHNSYGANHGLHDYYGNSGSNAHANHGHDRYGQLSRYGNHGYGKKGSNYGAHQDYGHNLNKGHYYAQNSHPTSYHSSSHYSQPPPPPVPTYRSTYSDYSPQIGYPSSYPSYY